MALEMDWSPDFCLSCDRQISQSGHGAYCSQSCRLADLERASCSSTSSSPQTAATSSSWASSNLGSGSGFYLPPPLNFAAISGRQPTPACSPTMRSPLSTTPPGASQHYPSSYSSQNGRTSQLYSSPSRSSLSSLQGLSQPDPATLSAKVKNELRDYASSFDHVRDWKRRMTVE